VHPARHPSSRAADEARPGPDPDAAQSAQIGVAEAEFYPHIAINGTWEYSAEFFKNLWTTPSLNGAIGPTFTWNILNYGRILNNVRLQDAKFQQLVATYQNSVLTAAGDVENGLVTFLKGQQQTKFQAESVKDARQAVDVALAQYKAGTVDFTRVTQLEQTLVSLQDTLAQDQGAIVTGLIQVYEALGGGWQIRQTGCDSHPADRAAAEANTPDQMPRVRFAAPRIADGSSPVP
jgi:outer membrane protein TolC